MLTLRLLERVRDVPKEAWDALVPENGSPFVEWTWLDCLEEAGDVDTSLGDREMSTGWIARHLALFRDGALVGAAPMYVKLHSDGEFVFDWAWADLSHRLGHHYYPKLVIGVPFTPAAGERVLVAPGEDRAEVVRLFAEATRAFAKKLEASSVHVLFPREDELALWTAHDYLPRYGFQYQFFRGADRTFDDYVARYRSKKRNQIRREVAQPAKDGIRIETLPPDAITRDLARTMYRFYASTVDKYIYGRRYLSERFFELVAERFKERLAWVVATENGTPIAGAFNVQKANRLYGRYWGTDREMPFLHFNVCYYHGIRRCFDLGLDVFEPGAGGEHKRARGFVPTLTYSAHWIANARLRAILTAHLERERSQVEAFVRSGGDDGEG